MGMPRDEYEEIRDRYGPGAVHSSAIVNYDNLSEEEYEELAAQDGKKARERQFNQANRRALRAIRRNMSTRLRTGTQTSGDLRRSDRQPGPSPQGAPPLNYGGEPSRTPRSGRRSPGRAPPLPYHESVAGPSNTLAPEPEYLTLSDARTTTHYPANQWPAHIVRPHPTDVRMADRWHNFIPHRMDDAQLFMDEARNQQGGALARLKHLVQQVDRNSALMDVSSLALLKRSWRGSSAERELKAAKVPKGMVQPSHQSPLIDWVRFFDANPHSIPRAFRNLTDPHLIPDQRLIQGNNIYRVHQGVAQRPPTRRPRRYGETAVLGPWFVPRDHRTRPLRARGQREPPAGGRGLRQLQ